MTGPAPQSGKPHASAFRPKSLAGQLMLWITVITTCLWLVAVGFGALVMQDEFGEIFDSALQDGPTEGDFDEDSQV